MKINGIEFDHIDLGGTNYSNINVPTVSVSKDRVSFNNSFLKEVNYAEYIEMYINLENHVLAFKCSNDFSETARKLCAKKRLTSNHHPVNIVNKEMVGIMKKIIGSQKNKIIGKKEWSFHDFRFESE